MQSLQIYEYTTFAIRTTAIITTMTTATPTYIYEEVSGGASAAQKNRHRKNRSDTKFCRFRITSSVAKSFF
jgi:hypothetical protein